MVRLQKGSFSTGFHSDRPFRCFLFAVSLTSALSLFLGGGEIEEMFDTGESDGKKAWEGASEPIDDEATMGGVRLALWPGVIMDAKSSAVRAELKVFSPFGFLARGSSFASSKLELTVALKALILAARLLWLVSFRAAVRFFREDSESA